MTAELTWSGIAWRLAGVLALVFANGFFVAAEFAIVAVRKTRVDQLVAEGVRRAISVRRAVNDPDRYIAATQLGITMASLGLGWIGEPTFAALLQPLVASVPPHLADATVHSAAVALAFSVITALHIVLGELAPKTIALEQPERAALILIPPTEWFMRAFSPFIELLNALGRAVVRVIGLQGQPHRGMVHSEEELKMLVTASQEAGVIEEQEEQMLHRVFDFADRTAGQLMVPRTELVAIEVGTSRGATIDLVARGRHTRLPVYRGDLDHIIGALHVTDLVRALANPAAPFDLAALSRDMPTVPETMGADTLLQAMRRSGVREALVIDEYGGTAGLVTFDSMMQRIVGDLGAIGGLTAKIVRRPDGSADVDGLALVSDVNEQFGLHIDDAEFTTVGGYVLGALGRRPTLGDEVGLEGRVLRVDALDGIRVARVWISAPRHP